ncbi:MAG: FHA domain-containing protein [Microcystaceae cyanobacterium]
MITLILLHPGQTVPVQNWTFETESIIRVGRSKDNDVILYSAVVSRHHLEIRRSGSGWELVNVGANGTYINEQPITTTLAVDGMIIRLASSGPKIQIRIPPEEPKTKLTSRHFAQAHITDR